MAGWDRFHLPHHLKSLAASKSPRPSPEFACRVTRVTCILSAMSDAIARLNAALEGRYTIERELGEGGMATVYLGR